MKMQNRFTVLALALAGLGVTGAAQAEYVGNASDTTTINVGQSTVTGGPHIAGKAGVSVTSLGSGNFVDFSGISAYASASSTTPPVYTLDYSSQEPTDHSQMGHFNFAQVGSSDIWFGEWSQTASASDGTHSVYYVGDNTGTTIPISGTVTYTVAGISNYSVNGILSGSFTADFAGSTLSGNLANSASTYGITATINAAAASFSGAATSSNTSAAGSVSGNFYGADAASLAGIASFGGNSVYDVAFGGTKQ